MPSERPYQRHPVSIQDFRGPAPEPSPSRSSSAASSRAQSETSSSAYSMGGPVQTIQAPRDIVREGGCRESVYRVPGAKKETVTKVARERASVINQEMRREDEAEPRSKDASSSDFKSSSKKKTKKK